MTTHLTSTEIERIDAAADVAAALQATSHHARIAYLEAVKPRSTGGFFDATAANVRRKFARVWAERHGIDPTTATQIKPGHNEFALTDIERACGVTMEDVRRVRRESYVFDGGRAVAVSWDVPPALGAAAARLALGGPAGFMGRNQLGQGVYREVPK